MSGESGAKISVPEVVCSKLTVRHPSGGPDVQVTADGKSAFVFLSRSAAGPTMALALEEGRQPAVYLYSKGRSMPGLAFSLDEHGEPIVQVVDSDSRGRHIKLCELFAVGQS